MDEQKTQSPALKGRRVNVWLTNGFYYDAVVEAETETTLYVTDKHGSFLINRSAISSVKIYPEASK